MLLQIGLNIPWRGWNKMNLLWSNFLFMFFDLYERAPLVPMPFAWSVQVGRSVAKSRMILLDGIGVALQPKGLYWLMICKQCRSNTRMEQLQWLSRFFWYQICQILDVLWNWLQHVVAIQMLGLTWMNQARTDGKHVFTQKSKKVNIVVQWLYWSRSRSWSSFFVVDWLTNQVGQVHLKTRCIDEATYPKSVGWVSGASDII